MERYIFAKFDGTMETHIFEIIQSSERPFFGRIFNSSTCKPNNRESGFYEIENFYFFSYYFENPESRHWKMIDFSPIQFIDFRFTLDKESIRTLCADLQNTDSADICANCIKEFYTNY